MNRIHLALLSFVVIVAIAVLPEGTLDRVLRAQGGKAVPTFRVDPSWPTLPSQWTLGQVAGLAVDARDHVWIIQRPWSLTDEETAKNPGAACCTAPPPVMEFDPQGHYVQGWGGPGEGYEWPADEHTIHVDYKDNVWISSAGGPRLPTRKENFILKFTRQGKFLLQIGKRGASTGSLDTANFNNAADIYVYPKTNEVFVADGYVNRRVVVLDADTGAFKRMWGAYGKPPDDAASKERLYEGPAPQQFNLVHGVRVSDDGLVYVADRMNNRVQVFTIDGAFQTELFVERQTKLLGTAFSVAFSADPQQRYLYLADAGNGKVHIYERKRLEEVGSFGRIGRYAGQFIFLHNLAVDSKGNLFTAEVGGGRRVQKFIRTGP
ncbi:MAG TPA: beta-propeller fold lactonase family protein [Vicinamibacterales bacterium]|nr:beta-propeller fold lactonase family protein [Vicinamibacterales bacterium]